MSKLVKHCTKRTSYEGRSSLLWKTTEREEVIIPEGHDADKGDGGDLECLVTADAVVVAATHVLVSL